MNLELRVIDEDGDEFRIRGVDHPDWDGLGAVCPRCGAGEQRRFFAEGGRYGIREGAWVRRSDYWGSRTELLVACLGCNLVLYRHPAFELLYGGEGDEGSLDF